MDANAKLCHYFISWHKQSQ